MKVPVSVLCNLALAEESGVAILCRKAGSMSQVEVLLGQEPGRVGRLKEGPREGPET